MQRDHFWALDSWRGIAALLVALFHLQVYSHFAMLPFFRHGPLWVDFFFVLSGFVIAHSSFHYVRDGQGFRRFAIRRIGRVWPLHVAVILAFLVVELATLALTPWLGGLYPRAAFTGERSLDSLWLNIFLLNGIGLPGVESWNPPSWSVSTEIVAYAAFGLFCLLPHRWMPHLAGATVIVCGAIVLLLAPKYFSREDGIAVARCAYGFFTGCLLLLLYRRVGENWARWMSTLSEVVAVALAIGFVTWVGNEDNLPAMLAPAVFGLLVFVFAFGRGRLSAFLSLRPFLALGRWSYSVYMVHFLIVFLLNNGTRIAGKLLDKNLFTAPMLGNQTGLADFGGATVMDFVTLAYLGVVIAVAAMTYRWVERPGVRFARRLEVAPLGATAAQAPN